MATHSLSLGIRKDEPSHIATPQYPFIRQINRQTNSHYHHRFHSHQSRVKSIRRRLLFDSKNFQPVRPRSTFSIVSNRSSGPRTSSPLCISGRSFSLTLSLHLGFNSALIQMDSPEPVVARTLSHRSVSIGVLCATASSMTCQDQATTCGVCGVPRECQHEELSRLWVASRSGTEFMYR